ncbi:hypothetical protein [Peribacillus simplex]|nr:hypothetical protein [Peribacillus simplex]
MMKLILLRVNELVTGEHVQEGGTEIGRYGWRRNIDTTTSDGGI